MRADNACNMALLLLQLQLVSCNLLHADRLLLEYGTPLP
jgi:hypothetical protein